MGECSSVASDQREAQRTSVRWAFSCLLVFNSPQAELNTSTSLLVDIQGLVHILELPGTLEYKWACQHLYSSFFDLLLDLFLVRFLPMC
jgi:hypothetical protein